MASKWLEFLDIHRNNRGTQVFLLSVWSLRLAPPKTILFLQLNRAECFVNDLYYNKEYGLKLVVGPSLGILGESDAIDLEGGILGHVIDPVVPPGCNNVVVDEESDLPFRYCVADSSGYVFPGYVANQSFDRKNSRQDKFEQIRARETTAVGRLAWKPNRDCSSRVLVMGGNQKSRDNFLRWYADVEFFEYELIGSEFSAEALKFKQTLMNDDESRTGSVEMRSELEMMASTLPYTFKIISSFRDHRREEQLAELKKKQEAMCQQFAQMDKNTIEQRVKRFRHTGGETTAVSSLINDSGLTRLSWPLLTDHAALHLLYFGGAAAFSPLGQFGRAADFVDMYTSRVRAEIGRGDSSKYFCAEVLLSLGDRVCTEISRPPDSLILINAPDIVSPNIGSNGCGPEVWQRIGHLLPEMLDHCRVADVDKSKTLSLSKFVELFEGLRPGGLQVSETDALKLLDLLVIDEAGRVEYEGMVTLINSASCPYDQVAAFDLIGDMCDVIIVLMDGKLSRFNDAETGILKGMYKNFKHKMHFGCINNHALRSELGAHLAETMADPAFGKIVSVGGDMPATNEFINSAVNEEQIRLSALLNCVQYNVESLLLRLEHLYSRSKSPSEDAPASSCDPIIDGHAVAAANSTLIRACKQTKSLLGPTQGLPLLEQLRVALRVAKHAAQDVLSRSGFVPLSYAKRCEMWEAKAKWNGEILDAVQGLHVSRWVTPAHIDTWLESVGAMPSTRAAFQAEGVGNVHGLLRVDSTQMALWGVAVSDRLRIQRGLRAVKRAFEQRRTDYVCEGLWQLVKQRGAGGIKASVRIEPKRLYDQGPAAAPNLGGWRDGDKVMLEATGHGRVAVTVPCRADLERTGFNVEVEMEGGYISPQDLSLMYAVLTEQVECGANSRRMLEDGLHLMLTGDLPPLLLAEVVADIRADAAAGPVQQPPQNNIRVYGKRWAHDAAIAAERVPDSDSEEECIGDDLALMTREDARSSAEDGLHCIFDAVANGRVVADGRRLQTELYRDKRMIGLLRRLGIRFLPGRVAVLEETDVLRREFVEGVLSLF
jgi:hypothetical protein